MIGTMFASDRPLISEGLNCFSTGIVTPRIFFSTMLACTGRPATAAIAAVATSRSAPRAAIMTMRLVELRSRLAAVTTSLT